jgi:hypothetical protein
MYVAADWVNSFTGYNALAASSTALLNLINKGAEIVTETGEFSATN